MNYSDGFKKFSRQHINVSSFSGPTKLESSDTSSSQTRMKMNSYESGTISSSNSSGTDLIPPPVFDQRPRSPQLRGKMWWQERIKNKPPGLSLSKTLNAKKRNLRRNSDGMNRLPRTTDPYLLSPPKLFPEIPWYPVESIHVNMTSNMLQIELEPRPSTPLPPPNKEKTSISAPVSHECLNKSFISDSAVSKEEELYCQEFGIKDYLSISLDDICGEEDEDFKISEFKFDFDRRKSDVGSCSSRVGPPVISTKLARKTFSKTIRKVLLVLKFRHFKGQKPLSGDQQRVTEVSLENLRIQE
ncbi:Uncharacterised protein g6269 [Pycnogonum litorale]